MSKVMDVINAKGDKKPTNKQVLDSWLAKAKTTKKVSKKDKPSKAEQDKD